jgi:hypothetical protein
MATPDEMIAQLEAFLLSNVGIAQIRHPDGRSVNLDRGQAIKELVYWNTKKAQQASAGLVMSRYSLKGDA